MEESENGVLVSGNANDLVDNMLREVEKKYIDPLPMEFESENIHIKDGQIHGLSKIRRSGNCTFIADDKGTKITLNLEISNISASFKYSFYAGFMWIKGNMQSEIEYIEMKPEISLLDGKVRLDSLEITRLEGTKVIKLTGILPPFRWLVRIIMNEIFYMLRPEIKKILEKEAKENVQIILNKISRAKL